MVEPLSHEQKLFNQRLLAAHVLTETEAKSLWKELSGDDDDFAENVAQMNDALQHVGLEIVAVTLKQQQAVQEDDDDEEEPGGSQPNANKRMKMVRHYAMINLFPDEIAKQSFQHSFGSKAQYAFVNLVLATLVQGGNDETDDENEDGNGTTSTSPYYGMTRSQLLNLRTQLPEPHNKLALDPTERALDQLLQQGWLMEQKVPGRTAGKTKTLLTLGARSYLELSHLLTDEWGMDKQDLPQTIYHRM